MENQLTTESQLVTETQMQNYVDKKFKYLVVYPDKTWHFFKSLREIGSNISVDASTISKKMESSDHCICVARVSGYVFWVKKLN